MEKLVITITVIIGVWGFLFTYKSMKYAVYTSPWEVLNSNFSLLSLVTLLIILIELEAIRKEVKE